MGLISCLIRPRVSIQQHLHIQRFIILLFSFLAMNLHYFQKLFAHLWKITIALIRKKSVPKNILKQVKNFHNNEGLKVNVVEMKIDRDIHPVEKGH